MATMVASVRQSVKGISTRSEPKSSTPQWEGAVVGYAVNFLSRHAWRVRREMDLDDLLQDAYLLFLKLSDVYEGESPAKFMAMWKTALRNRLINTSSSCNARGRRRTHCLDGEDFVEQGSDLQQLEWRWHEQEAPAPVKQLIRTVANRQRRPRPRIMSGTREKTNDYLCRLARVPTSTPLRSLLGNWLAAAQK